MPQRSKSLGLFSTQTARVPALLYFKYLKVVDRVYKSVHLSCLRNVSQSPPKAFFPPFKQRLYPRTAIKMTRLLSSIAVKLFTLAIFTVVGTLATSTVISSSAGDAKFSGLPCAAKSDESTRLWTKEKVKKSNKTARISRSSLRPKESTHPTNSAEEPMTSRTD